MIKKSSKLKLKPTLKEKRHYLVLKIFSSQSLTEREIKEKIDTAIFGFIGTLGYANAGPQYIKTASNYAILSVTTKYVDYVKSALAINKDRNINIQCVGVSGTLLKAQRFLE